MSDQFNNFQVNSPFPLNQNRSIISSTARNQQAHAAASYFHGSTEDGIGNGSQRQREIILNRKRAYPSQYQGHFGNDSESEGYSTKDSILKEQEKIENGDSPDVAAEVEVDVEGETEHGDGNSLLGLGLEANRIVVVSNGANCSLVSQPTRSNVHIPGPSCSSASASTSQKMMFDPKTGLPLRPSLGRGRINTAPHSSLQQLLRFDPTKCFDIDLLRSRIIAAQQRIEDFYKLNLNNMKLKHENIQLRDDLAKCEGRMYSLETTVLERNERLKELLKENVFMRAQLKKIQNEFGIDSVRAVFNGTNSSRDSRRTQTQQQPR